MRGEFCELTNLCLVHSGDRYLLQNRVGKDWQGYALPGGHVEPGESVVESVIREIREETGLIIKNPRLCGIKQFPTDGGRYIVFLFETEEFSGELCPSDEGEMRWVCKDQLKSLKTVDDLEKLISVMISPDLNEFQYVIEDGVWRAVLR